MGSASTWHGDAGLPPAVPSTLAELDPERILVGMLCPIGDALFATPALAALRRRFPRAHITALAYPSNVGILEGNPDVDECAVVDHSGSGSSLLLLARTAGVIKLSGYGLMVNFSPASSFLGLLAGVPEQISLRMPPKWWLLGSHSRSYSRRHTVDQYLNVIRPLLEHDVPEGQRHPRVYLSPAHRAAARRLLRACGLGAAGPLVAMHVGADGFRGRKRWSTERFAAVGGRLAERFGARILLMGGAGDVAPSEEVAARMGRGAVVLAGRTSLLETAALVERATLFIGNDSCPLHIAAAVGTPAVGIFGPSDVEQFRPIGPSGYRPRVVRAELPCSPCFHFVGNDAPWVPNLCHSRACLKAIDAEDVLAAATELLVGQAPAPARAARPMRPAGRRTATLVAP
jgi:lipopolysaccharide heptosyltransferase II